MGNIRTEIIVRVTLNPDIFFKANILRDDYWLDDMTRALYIFIDFMMKTNIYIYR